MPELTVPATVDNIAQITDFVELQLADCPLQTRMQISLVLDELVSNIAYYAYAPAEGPVTVRVDREPERVVLTLRDRGIPYDPLSAPEPDLTLDLEERGVGGLGIFLVRQTMDDVAYCRRDGQNILTVQKNLQ